MHLLPVKQYDEACCSTSGRNRKKLSALCRKSSKPMPFYIGVPVAEGNKMKINWDNSYSFDAEDITYSVEIAKDYLFQDVIYTQDGLLIPGNGAGASGSRTVFYPCACNQ